MTKERFERNWRVSVDSLKREQAYSDYYAACPIPGTRVAVVGPFEVWEHDDDYTVSRDRVACTLCRDLRPFLAT